MIQFIRGMRSKRQANIAKRERAAERKSDARAAAAQLRVLQGFAEQDRRKCDNATHFMAGIAYAILIWMVIDSWPRIPEMIFSWRFAAIVSVSVTLRLLSARSSQQSVGRRAVHSVDAPINGRSDWGGVWSRLGK